MDRKQLVDLYNLVATNWNLQPTSEKELVKKLETWNRYLGDVDYQKAVHEIDRLALAGGYPPRPAEVRVLVLAGNDLPPIPAIALAQAHELTKAIRNGTHIPQTHPVVAGTIEKYGLGRDDMFLRVYEEVRRDYLAATYSDGANMNNGTEDQSG